MIEKNAVCCALCVIYALMPCRNVRHDKGGVLQL